MERQQFMASILRLKHETTLKELLRALLSMQGKVVYVYIPDNSSLWQPKSLRLIRRAGIETKKKVVIVSNSRVGRIKAEKAGLTAVTEDQIYKGSAAKKAMRNIDPTESKPSAISKSAEKKVRRVVKKPKKKRRFLLVGSALTALIAGFVVSNILLQEAVITVYARSDTSSLNINALIDKNRTEDELSNNTLQGFAFEQEFTQSNNFKATGERNQGVKARGEVVITNKYPSTLTLRSDTTYLLSSSGQRYRFARHVTGLRPNVPYRVEVVAETSGSTGNLDAGASLEVHNSAFGFRPAVLYANVSQNGIKGGKDELSIVVSEQDVSRAKEKLIEEAVSKAKADVKSSLGIDKILIDRLIKTEIVSSSFDAEVGDKQEHFSGKATVVVNGLIFDKNSLISLAESHAREQDLPNKLILGVDENSFSYDVRSWNTDTGVAVVGVEFNSLITNKLNPSDLKTLLSGRTPEEIKNILLTKSEIAGVKIDLSPFWLQSTPESSDRVDIKIEVGQ